LDLATLLGPIAARWDGEVLVADTQELLGLDQSHLRTTAAIVRFWTLVRAAYTLLEEESATSSGVRLSTVHAGIQTLQARCTGTLRQGSVRTKASEGCTSRTTGGRPFVFVRRVFRTRTA
jgi:hypothetical protein